MELRAAVLDALSIADPQAKAAATRSLGLDGMCRTLDARAVLTPDRPLPGRPERPRLVEPRQVPRRTPFTREGRAALLHAVAHIDFNAIKLVYN